MLSKVLKQRPVGQMVMNQMRIINSSKYIHLRMLFQRQVLYENDFLTIHPCFMQP